MSDLLTSAKAALASVTVGRPSILELRGYLQPFEYGREGSASMAARYAKLVDPSIKIKEGQPYGEIWLGSTHKNGPSTILTSSLLTNGTKLRDVIASDPEYYLGSKLLANAKMQEMYRNDLPFLFKILSFDKALPLQAHPDPELGRKLRKQEKTKYLGLYNSDFVDDNGKPEVSVALSDFTAFVGFRPPKQIQAFVRQVPAFAALLSSTQLSDLDEAAESDSLEKRKSCIKSLFGTCIALSQSQIKQVVTSVNTKLQSGNGASSAFDHLEDADALAKVWRKNLATFGEGDVGIVVTTFLMNLLQLKAGQGCWILADDIHAYVEGDVIECMANSDNMVCHGLGDTEQGGLATFVDMLSYRHLPANQLELTYSENWQGQAGARYYKVPISEFAIVRISLSNEDKEVTLTGLGPHTLVVTKGTIIADVAGERLELSEGHSAFVRAGATLCFTLAGDASSAEVYGAFYDENEN